ncbi:MAG: SprB repeat-containing protein [Saprospiraceae bacterium]|nr:SprB repeat-containing protein [Saprospiraceae bacterium]
MEVEVGVADPIVITATPDPICEVNTGKISPVITGGSGSYTFAWSNGQTTQEISGLDVGSFRLTVTDENGCTGSKIIKIETKSLGIAANGISDLCQPGDVGSITLTVTNGVAPIEFLWNNGATTSFLNNLPVGSYSVTVSDQQGCSETKLYKIGQSVQIYPEGDNVNLNTTVVHSCGSEMSGAIALGVPNCSNCKYEWKKDGGVFTTTKRTIPKIGCGYLLCYSYF